MRDRQSRLGGSRVVGGLDDNELRDVEIGRGEGKSQQAVERS